MKNILKTAKAAAQERGIREKRNQDRFLVPAEPLGGLAVGVADKSSGGFCMRYVN